MTNVYDAMPRIMEGIKPDAPVSNQQKHAILTVLLNYYLQFGVDLVAAEHSGVEQALRQPCMKCETLDQCQSGLASPRVNMLTHGTTGTCWQYDTAKCAAQRHAYHVLQSVFIAFVMLMLDMHGSHFFAARTSSMET